MGCPWTLRSARSHRRTTTLGSPWTLRCSRTLRRTAALGHRALLLVGRPHRYCRAVLIAVAAWLLRWPLLLTRGAHRHRWARG